MVLDGKDPYFTDYMFHPLGTSLLLHNYTEFNDAVGLVLAPFLNDIAITNVMGMLSTVLSGLGVYVLAKYLTQNTAASLFAAIAFAFTPFRMNRLMFQMHMALTQWIPFALLMFIRGAEEHKLKYSVLTGVFFALAYYCNPYFAAYLSIAFVFTLPFGLFLFSAWREIGFLKHGVVAAAVAAVLLTPVALRFYKDYQENTVYSYSYTPQAVARVGRYFQRGFLNQYLNNLLGETELNERIGNITRKRRYSDITPGWIALAAGVAGIFCAFLYRHKKFIVLTFVALGFFLLSLGPYASDRTIKMPFYWFTKIPYINHVRTPERFAVMVTLVLTLTGAYFLSLVLPKLKGKKKIAAVILLFALLLIELAPVPLIVKRFEPPKIFSSLKRMEGDVMLTLPYDLGPADSYYLAYQIMHHKKVLDGRISRTPLLLTGYFRHLPVIRSLDILTRTGKLNRRKAKYDPKVGPLFRRFFGVRYLVLYTPYSQRPDVLLYIERVFPDAELLSDEQDIKVYELPRLVNDDYVIKSRNPAMNFFLLSSWDVNNNHIVCRSDEAQLLLPTAGPDKNLDVLLRTKFASSGQSKFVVAGHVVKEIPTSPSVNRVSLTIPASLLQKSHGVLRIQLVNDVEEKHAPGFELVSLKIKYQ
jgi:hypothetical protein